ncbi:MAG: YpdA family putative bacillithiol disulfide reductase [Bacteroidia bacterium]|nr:YpdA family putative bacillithiol disulfide reductase [Bacteroidia bacterium]
MQKNKPLDILVIGGGPIGLACGIEASRHKLSHLIIEKGTLVNSLYNYPIHMTFFSTSEKLEMGNVPFMSLNPKPNRQEALEYFRRVKEKWDLQVNTYEEVLEVVKENGLFTVRSNKGSYQAKNLIVATGFYDHPNLLGIPGENLNKVSHYFKEAHPYIDQEVIVIGARNSAVDAALEVWRKGGRVTMIIRKNEIHQKVKYWVRPDIMNRIKAGEIKAYFNSTVKEIREKEVLINTSEGEKLLPNDFVLAMTGFSPDYGLLGMLGIEIEEGELSIPKINPETHESSVPGIYLAGTVCGGKQTNKWFIENSIDHAGKILRSIALAAKL